jgi:hypothetical protein
MKAAKKTKASVSKVTAVKAPEPKRLSMAKFITDYIRTHPEGTIEEFTTATAKACGRTPSPGYVAWVKSDLAEITSKWARLSDDTKKEIMALVRKGGR